MLIARLVADLTPGLVCFASNFSPVGPEPMHKWSTLLAVAATFVLPLAAVGEDAAQHDVDALKQNFLAEHEIGRRYRVDPDNLPPPKSGAIVTNRPLTLPYTGQAPQVPPGFSITPFATGLVNPRRLLVLPNGDVLVAEQRAGYLTLLRGVDGARHAPGLSDTSRISTSLTVLLGATIRCWSPIRTVSGKYRTNSARCGRVARSSSASSRSRRRNASRFRAPMARRCSPTRACSGLSKVTRTGPSLSIPSPGRYSLA